MKEAHLITVIDSRRGWFDLNLRELWRYRYLVALFVYRDFVVHYKQTILGPAWWLLQPLFTTVIFTVVFSKIANLSTDSIPAPLFYLSGIIIWNYFLQCFLHTSQSFFDNREIFKRIFFPRLVLPIAATLSNLMRLALQFSLFVVFYLAFCFLGFSVRPSWLLLLFPFLVLYLALFAFGLGLLTASLSVKYRDILLTLPFLTQLWMFVSVVVYPLSIVPPAWRFWFSLNPVVPPIELFRSMCFGTGDGGLSTSALFCGMTTTALVLFLGMLVFTRIERTFADTI